MEIYTYPLDTDSHISIFNYRAAQLVHSIRKLPYEECLKHLGLHSIKEQVLRGDLILTYKILTKTNLDANQFFEMSMDSRTKVHQMKLLKRR